VFNKPSHKQNVFGKGPYSGTKVTFITLMITYKGLSMKCMCLENFEISRMCLVKGFESLLKYLLKSNNCFQRIKWEVYVFGWLWDKQNVIGKGLWILALVLMYLHISNDYFQRIKWEVFMFGKQLWHKQNVLGKGLWILVLCEPYQHNLVR
jgi:hypothetical protein